MNRRDFMKLSGASAGLVLIPVANLAVADAPVHLSVDDAQAKALGYVEQTPDAKSNCANCLQATGDLTAEWVGCKLFPGKLVKGAGWCKVWSPQPA